MVSVYGSFITKGTDRIYQYYSDVYNGRYASGDFIVSTRKGVKYTDEQAVAKGREKAFAYLGIPDPEKVSTPLPVVQQPTQMYTQPIGPGLPGSPIPAIPILAETYRGISIWQYPDGQYFTTQIKGTFGDLTGLHAIIDANPSDFGLPPLTVTAAEVLSNKISDPSVDISRAAIKAVISPCPRGASYMDWLRIGPCDDGYTGNILTGACDCTAQTDTQKRGSCPEGQIEYDAGILGKACIPDVTGAFNKISGYIIPGIIVLVLIVVLGLIKK